MKKHLFFCLLFPALLPAQDRPELAVSRIDTSLLKNADAVVRYERIDLDVTAPGKANYKTRHVATLFNDKSNLDLLVVHYDKSNKLGKITGKLYDANGKLLRELGKKEVRDQSAISWFSIYEDDRVRILEVEHHEYPYTVEFEFEMAYKALMDYPGWWPGGYNVAVEKTEYDITLPSGMSLFHQTVNLPVVPAITMEGGTTAYLWVVENMPAVVKEPFGPMLGEVMPGIRLAPGMFEIEGYQGSMASWKEFGAFNNRLREGRDELSPAMKKTVGDLTASATSDREKIDTLYRYLQQNMRYVSVQLGIGGWQPFPATYVEENKYGDCKALSNFMGAMLKEAGIQSCPALIFSGDLGYEMQEDFASNVFNHVILHVPSENYWLECTSSNDPPNYLGAGTDDRNVLLITDEGGVVARTPALTPELNLEQNDLQISLAADGQAHLSQTTVQTGVRQEWHRYYAGNVQREEMEKHFQEQISLPSFTLEKLEVTADPDQPRATVVCEANVPRFASKAGKRLFLPLIPLNAFTDVPPDTEKRIHPIERRRGYTETDRITIALPPGYGVESLPNAPFTIESGHVKYYLKVTEGENTVTMERRLEVLPCRLPAEEYGAWREVYKQIAKADGGKLVLVAKT